MKVDTSYKKGYTVVTVTKGNKSKTRRLKGNFLGLTELPTVYRLIDKIKKELENE